MWQILAVLMVGDDQRRRQLVRLPVLDADGGEDAPEDMGLHGLFPVRLLHLREDAHAGLRLVPVLCREDFLHLVVEVVFPADVHHALDDLVMVDALHGLVVDVVFLVGTPERLEAHRFDSVLLEVELSLSFQYCQCVHNLEFYEVNTVNVRCFSGMYLPSVERLQCDREGPVGDSVVEQASHDADTPVGITLREAERVRGVVVVE